MDTKTPHMRWWRTRLVVAGLIGAVVLCEILFQALDLPRQYRPVSKPEQFAVLRERDGNYPTYVNAPSSILTFVYDGNPRGTFGRSNEVKHATNAAGFRGGEFTVVRTPGTLRVAFLGDSFTFGEGVPFEHTYPEVTARLLERQWNGLRVESQNFGVGGYNTRQALWVLRQWVVQCQPDAVVLGYALNDADDRLFVFGPTGQPVRRPPRPETIERAARPPRTVLMSLRTLRLLWSAVAARRANRQLMDWYRSLYAPDSAGWADTQRALAEIAAVCRERRVPLYVVCFPVFHRLEDYPLADIHDRIRRAVTSNGARWIDLLPLLAGRRSADLWVHPSDPHPNEIAHEAAARALAERLVQDGTTTVNARTLSPPPGGTP